MSHSYRLSFPVATCSGQHCRNCYNVNETDIKEEYKNDESYLLKLQRLQNKVHSTIGAPKRQDGNFEKKKKISGQMSQIWA
jgi:ribosomal protein L44E